MNKGFFSSLASSLSSSGVAQSMIPSILSGIAKLHTNTVNIQPQLNQLAVVANDPGAIAALVDQIVIQAGVPPAAVSMLSSLKMPGVTAAQVFQVIQATEASVAAG